MRHCDAFMRELSDGAPPPVGAACTLPEAHNNSNGKHDGAGPFHEIAYRKVTSIFASHSNGVYKKADELEKNC